MQLNRMFSEERQWIITEEEKVPIESVLNNYNQKMLQKLLKR